MKRIEKDTLKSQFRKFKSYGIQTKVGTGVYSGLSVSTTTGDTITGTQTSPDGDCDSDNDTTSTGGPPPVLKIEYWNNQKW